MTKLKIMHEAICLGMKINGGAVERNGHGHPTAFIYYSGHINVLEIEIHENGWVADSDPEKRYRLDFDATAENLLEQLENLREYAKELTRRRRRV